jgi:hypothetical protein
MQREQGRRSRAEGARRRRREQGAVRGHRDTSTFPRNRRACTDEPHETVHTVEQRARVREHEEARQEGQNRFWQVERRIVNELISQMLDSTYIKQGRRGKVTGVYFDTNSADYKAFISENPNEINFLRDMHACWGLGDMVRQALHEQLRERLREDAMHQGQFEYMHAIIMSALQ